MSIQTEPPMTYGSFTQTEHRSFATEAVQTLSPPKLVTRDQGT